MVCCTIIKKYINKNVYGLVDNNKKIKMSMAWCTIMKK